VWDDIKAILRQNVIMKVTPSNEGVKIYVGDIVVKS
jgi:hypothetical protein